MTFPLCGCLTGCCLRFVLPLSNSLIGLMNPSLTLTLSVNSVHKHTHPLKRNVHTHAHGSATTGIYQSSKSRGTKQCSAFERDKKAEWRKHKQYLIAVWFLDKSLVLLSHVPIN